MGESEDVRQNQPQWVMELYLHWTPPIQHKLEREKKRYDDKSFWSFYQKSPFQGESAVGEESPLIMRNRTGMEVGCGAGGGEREGVKGEGNWRGNGVGGAKGLKGKPPFLPLGLDRWTNRIKRNSK